MTFPFYLALACALFFIYGAILALFRKGKRRRGLGVMLAAFIGFALAAILDAERQAQEEGWPDSTARREAQEAGISTPQEWAAKQDEIAAELAAQAERDRVERQKAEAEQQRIAQQKEADRRKAGHHCLSGWDQTHMALKRALIQSLRNPDSFDHIETLITPVLDDGTHILTLTYRAENGFGGMDIGQVIAQIDNETCAVTEIIEQ